MQTFQSGKLVIHDYGDALGLSGWRCKFCDWAIMTEGSPPDHNCPEDGQELRRKWVDFNATHDHMQISFVDGHLEDQRGR